MMVQPGVMEVVYSRISRLSGVTQWRVALRLFIGLMMDDIRN